MSTISTSEPLTLQDMHDRAMAARARMYAAARRSPKTPALLAAREAAQAPARAVAILAQPPRVALAARPIETHEPGTDWKVHELLTIVAAISGLSVGDLKSEQRSLNLVRPRHVFFWLARRFTSRSLPFIGTVCGGRDHTTVLHGVRKIEVVAAAIAPPDRDHPDAWARSLLAAAGRGA